MRWNRVFGLSVALLAGCGSGMGLTGSGGRRGGGGLAGAAGPGGAAVVAGAGGQAGLGGPGGETSLVGGAGGGSTAYETTILDRVQVNKLDLLFMIDNSSSMTGMQQKLVAQLPAFLQVLENLPTGLPNIHIAVVSSDMGAPGDSTAAVGCSFQGDAGSFYFQPRGTCTTTTLSNGATFISDGDSGTNFTAPIETVLQCISLIGSSGCGFEQPLASIDRALGGDGMTPDGNAGFLRPDAVLGIILLTNEDDCSAPPDTTIYSLNGASPGLSNPDGPLGNYRCNGGPRGAHLCVDPATGGMIVPPVTPPADATGTSPTLTLQDCQDNETGSSALTPVSTFVQHIKALKSDPDNQIVVAAIAAPASPYAVQWVAPAVPPPGTAGELWPSVMHSCGAAADAAVNPLVTQTTTDGSFGDPAVRISQFVEAFPNRALASICDPSYLGAMTAVATKLGALMKPLCVPTGKIQPDGQGQPTCTVTNHLTASDRTITDVVVPNCHENGGSAPCWTLDSDPGCAPNSFVFHLVPDQATMNAADLSSTLRCTSCTPGLPGC